MIHIGCGNSMLGAHIDKHFGYLSVVNCDYSDVCIQKMKNLSPDTHTNEWKVVDFCHNIDHLGKFDYSLDKVRTAKRGTQRVNRTPALRLEILAVAAGIL